MGGIGQRFLRLPQWGQYTIVVVGALLVFALLTSGGGDDEADPAATKTVTVTTPASPATTTTTTSEPAETLADAQNAVEDNEYAKAIAIAATLGQKEVIRRRIANQIARRATAAVRAGNRSRASFLLQQANKYPSTTAVAQARSTYAVAKQRAADRAQARRAAAAQAEAERKAEEAAAAAPDPAPSGGDCDPGYSGCVPAYPPDVNCPDVDGPVQVTGSDPHGLDRDGDGVACE